MDEVAEAVRAVPSLSGRTYPWANEAITPPSAILPIPTGDFDETYKRGSDAVELNLIVLTSRAYDRANRDAVLAYVSGDGAESVKAAVEGHSYTTCDFVHVPSWDTQPDYFVGDIPYLALIFPLQIIGPGTT